MLDNTLLIKGESTWDHPCDGYYKRLYEEEKKKKEIVLKVSFLNNSRIKLTIYFLKQIKGKQRSKKDQSETRRRNAIGKISREEKQEEEIFILADWTWKRH